MRVLRVERGEPGKIERGLRRRPRRARAARGFWASTARSRAIRRRSPRRSRAASSGATRASSRPKMALALAADTCCETMIAARPAKPGSRRRKRRRAADRDQAARQARGPSPRRRFRRLSSRRRLVVDRPGRDDRCLACAGARLRRGLRAAPLLCIRFPPCAPTLTPPTPVLRFAPSPNGSLHLGHAYSALMQRSASPKHSADRLLLRIEDLDRTRCKPQFEAAILEDLAWLGLRFDGAPRRQSEHCDDYAAALARLEARGLVYPCFCSRAEIARAVRLARDPDGAPLYPGTCRALSAARERDRLALRRQGGLAARHASARSIAPPDRIDWLEYGEGCRRDRALAGSRRLGATSSSRGRDLAASYHLAVTVDDALQGVTDVVRGRDLLAATAVHRLLQDAARPSRAALSAPPAGARRRGSQAVEEPPVAVARRSARAGRDRGRRFARRSGLAGDGTSGFAVALS